MPDNNTLSIEPRTPARKRNRGLRRDGVVPGVIYGHRIDPITVSLPSREFEKAFHHVGRTQLLDLHVNGEAKPRRVLVREVQWSPRGSGVTHVDFYQVNLKEKIHADVPLVLVGESPAVAMRVGELLHNLHSLKVSVLPGDIPEHLEVDVSGLNAVDDGVRVSELTIADGMEVLSDPDEIVVKVTAVREVEPPSEADTAAAAADAATVGAASEAAAAPEESPES
ncbi:MAG: 50S ribosomal protein L25 [Candidatus Dormibacteria bacterium]